MDFEPMDWEVSGDDDDIIELGDSIELFVHSTEESEETEYDFVVVPQDYGCSAPNTVTLTEHAWRILMQKMRAIDLALLNCESMVIDLTFDTKVATWCTSARERFVKLMRTHKDGVTTKIDLPYTAWTTMVDQRARIDACSQVNHVVGIKGVSTTSVNANDYFENGKHDEAA
jgi:hypothetical protein